MNDLASTLNQGLHTPLRALRIALEELRHGGSNASILPGAIESVARLQRSVDAMQDFLEPRTPNPMSCTTRQVALSVRDMLGAHGSRLLVAHEGPPLSLFVDSELFAKSVVRLLQHEEQGQSSSSMLHVRTRGRRCRFTIVTQLPGTTGRTSTPLSADAAGRFGFTLALVARDLTRLGAISSFRIGSSGVALADVEIDAESSEQEAA